MNVKEELVKALKCNVNTIPLCADITYECYNQPDKHFALPLGYSGEQLAKFLGKLDFEYNEGYGTQQIFGTVWVENGAWLERAEYDCSEWWTFKQTPVIPDHLKPHCDHWE